MFNANELFDLSQTEYADIFAGCQHAWEALPKIAAFLEARFQPGLHNRCEGRAFIGEKVYIGAGTVVEDGAMIKGPAIIGKNCQIRHNAYVREHVLIGDNCVVGNSTEVKNSIFFNNVQAPHFNYVGDSILGHKAHLGAGVILSNFKVLPESIKVLVEGKPMDTGLRKFGALLGDGSEVGCNSVLAPGSVIGRSSVIYSGVSWRGYLAANQIVKNRSTHEIVARRVKA